MDCVKLPCAKFIMASLLTLGSFVFGCTMLGLKGTQDVLSPFYCSLITSSVTFWSVPPNYKNNENFGL